MKVLFGLFLIAHSIVHVLFIVPAPKDKNAPAWPFSMTESWTGLSTELLRPLGLVLLAVAMIGFIVLGLSVLEFLVPAEWAKWAGIVASIASILLMALFWNNIFIVGIGLSISVLVWFITNN